jgi:hypothetical protein
MTAARLGPANKGRRLSGEEKAKVEEELRVKGIIAAAIARDVKSKP